MTRRRRKRSGRAGKKAPRPEKRPGAPVSRTPGRSRRLVWILLLVAGLVGLVLVIPRLTVPPPLIPRVENMEAIDPALAAALRKATAAIEEAPHDGARYGALGRLYHGGEFFELAAECYSIAHQLDPETADWPYYLGRLEANRGRLDAAIEHLRQTLRVEPGYLPAQLQLGNAELRQGELDRAEQTFTEVIGAAPQAPWGYVGVAKVERRRGDLETAAASLEAGTTRCG